MPNVSATTNITYEDWLKIQDLIKNGDYQSTSHFIREAVKTQLKEK